MVIIRDKDNIEGEAKRYIYAYDPIIKRRVVHVVINGIAISLVTGNTFIYKPKKKK